MRSDVERAIEKFRINASGSQKHIEIAETMLHDDETVLFVTPTKLKRPGRRNGVPQVLFLTDKRIFSNSRGFLNRYTTESTSLGEVVSVNFTTDKTYAYIEINSPTKKQSIALTGELYMLKQVYQEFETAVNNYKAQQAAQNNAPQPDIADQIEKLAHLRDKGIITEEEFQTKKADLLSRM
ncbi:MAG: SHOCT domain-containing protein [Oscillospiraceae bacterium]|nr:SHOCT domain-containing protein [Oscillospiraceae bacterium]